MRRINFKMFHENSLGRIAVSTYHYRVNQDITRDDQDGCQNVNVPPEDIEIIFYSKETRTDL